MSCRFKAHISAAPVLYSNYSSSYLLGLLRMLHYHDDDMFNMCYLLINTKLNAQFKMYKFV